MINMISFANFDQLEKQAKFNDSPDAEKDAENFAAFLSFPIEQSPARFKDKETAELHEENQVNVVNQNSAINAPTPTEISSPFAEQKSFSTKTENFAAEQQIAVPKQENLAIDSKNSAIEQRNPTNSRQNLTIEQEISPLEQNISSQDKTVTAKNDKEFSTNIENEFSKGFRAKTEEKFQRGKSESVINAKLETGEIEILTDTANGGIEYFSRVELSSETIFPINAKNEITSRLPKLLSRVSDFFNEKALNPKVSGDNVSSAEKPPVKGESETSLNTAFAAQAPEKIGSTETDAKTASVSANFAQTEIKTPKAAKKSESHADFSAAGFEKFLTVPSAETKSVETAPVAVNVEPGEIIEQIEPQMLHFLSLDSVENEKKVMRMRLHPAELGAVEIRLEKDASGKLVADFQTENERTREILSESSAQLLDSLRDSGWHVERLEIVCSPFSSTNHSDRENGARQPEPVANRNVKTASDEDAALNGETKSNQSNRLLSVRA